MTAGKGSPAGQDGARENAAKLISYDPKDSTSRDREQPRQHDADGDAMASDLLAIPDFLDRRSGDDRPRESHAATPSSDHASVPEGVQDQNAAVDTMLAAALKYAARGWPVIPLRGKKPVIPTSAGGHGVHGATTDPGTEAA